MHNGPEWIWGAHWLWWGFWVLVVVAVAVLVVRLISSTQMRSESPETPLDILRRRYARGEISTEEYEERKAKLQED